MNNTMTTLDLIIPDDWEEFAQTGPKQETYTTTAASYDEVGAGQGMTDTPVTDEHGSGTALAIVAMTAALILAAVVCVVITAVKKKERVTDDTL